MTTTASRATASHASTSGSRSGRPVARTVLGWTVTLVLMLPLVWVVLLSFQPNEKILRSPLDFSEMTTSNYGTALATLDISTMYRNTIILAVASVTAGVVISYLAAFALTRMEWARKWLSHGIRFYFLAGLAIPVYILLFPVYKLNIDLHVFGTYWALILPYVATQLPFNILLFTGFLADFPSEIEEAAIIDGAGLMTVAWRVVFPLMKPVVATLVILNVIYVWNEYPFASILISDPSMTTVSLGISQFQGFWSVDYGAMMASATMMLIPQIALYAIFQRYVVAGMTFGAVKG